MRLGAKDVKVMARKPMSMLKASDWELEDVDGRRRSFREFEGRRLLLVLHRGMEYFRHS